MPGVEVVVVHDRGADVGGFRALAGCDFPFAHLEGVVWVPLGLRPQAWSGVRAAVQGFLPPGLYYSLTHAFVPFVLFLESQG